MFHKDLVLLQRPQINLARSTSARMWLVSLCAGMTILQSALTDSYRSLIIALCTVFSAAAVEMLIFLKTKKFTLGDGSAVASALILSLLLPNQIHPAVAALGAAFAIAVVKNSFGGLGTNWVNPALGGWFFIRFSWPVLFGDALKGSPLTILRESVLRGVADPQGSPLGIMKIGGIAAGTLDTGLTAALNTTVFSLTRTELSPGYLDFFVLLREGIIADRGLAAFLLGSVIITASQANRSWIPGIFLGVYAFFVRIFGALPFGGALGEGDLLFGLLTGGTLAAAFLLIADPVTGPRSNIGGVVVAALAGFFTFLFKFRGNEPYGAFFAVFLLNALTPLIRFMEDRFLCGARRFL
ncbi:MAG: RnfABCDGE type electron transport complex subunit D [Spirochaetaceae bacterium]|jgi:electron transport complex protein RnfD|nr:RnfABCDGE type electron transport complex subunit D [Spirochaetaceae bacterium]